MATKRTRKTVGNRRYTTTTTLNNGKTTTTRSESSAGNTKPGQIRVTQTSKNGKINTIMTTNHGNGWYTRKSANGIERERGAQQKRAQEFWSGLFCKTKGKVRSKTLPLTQLFYLAIALSVIGWFAQ